MAIELATAYVSLVPSGSKFVPAFKGQTMAPMKKAGSQLGAKLMSGLKRAAKVTAVGAGVAVGAAMVGGVKSGIRQQNAQKVLSGLYGSLDQAKSMMKSLGKVSESSPIRYDDYTKAAEALAYAGVKGKDATRTLKNVGLAIVAAGGDGQQLEGVTGGLTDIVNRGKVTMDSLNRISTAGVPIISGLAEHFGISMDAVNKKVAAGGVKMEDVLSVMSEATGKNFKMALKAGGEAAGSLGNEWKIAVDNITRKIGTALLPVIDKLGPIVKRAGEMGVAAIDILVDSFKNVSRFVQDNIAWIGPLSVAIATFAGVIGGVKLAVQAWTTATRIAKGVQLAFNLVMAANPIMLVVAAVAALVAGLVYFFTQTKLGKQLWQGFVGFLKDSWNNIVAFFQTTFTNLSDWWDGLWSGVKTVVSNVWNGIKSFFKGALDWVLNLFLNWTVYGLIIKNWDAIAKFFSNLWDGIVSFVRTAIGRVLSVVRSVTSTISNIWKSIWHGISSTFSGIWNRIVGVVRKFGGIFKSAFRGISGFVRSAFQGVLSAVKGPINGVIGLLNGAIRGLNRVSVTIPGWVPVVGGKSFGIHLPTIPRLAEGATVLPRAGGTLAVLAEAGRPESVVDTGLLNRALRDGIAGERSSQTVVQGPLVQVDQMVVDSDERVDEVAQALFERSERASRAGGGINLGGAVTA